MAEHDGFQDHCPLRYMLRLGLDHHDRVLRTGNHEIQVADLFLFRSRED